MPTGDFSEEQIAVDKKLDEVLLRILKDGRKVVTKQGDVVTVDPTAADLGCARQRCKDLGMSHVITEGDPAKELYDRLRLAPVKDLGPVPVEPETNEASAWTG